MQTTTRRLSAAAVLIAAASILSAETSAEPAATAPGSAGEAKTPAASAKTDKELLVDLRKNLVELKGLMPSRNLLSDPAKREEMKPKVVPLVQAIVKIYDDLAIARPEAKEQIQSVKVDYQMMLYLLGDKDALAAITKIAESKDMAEALPAKAALLQAEWILANKDEAKQAKLAETVQKLDKENPESNDLTILTEEMARSATNKELAEKLHDIAANQMKSQIAATLQVMFEQAKKLKEFENKPMVITGKDLAGKAFTTADWKGKVILVDFWATWCGPCIEEMPRVKKLYAEHHAKGLEILGVSNDVNGESLKKYLETAEMPWPEIFDSAAAEAQKFHPETERFGVGAIPTMFLIDKKGNLRSSNARESMEELVPKLLAE